MVAKLFDIKGKKKSPTKLIPNNKVTSNDDTLLSGLPKFSSGMLNSKFYTKYADDRDLKQLPSRIFN